MTIKYTDYIKKDGELHELEPKINKQSNCTVGEFTYNSGVTPFSTNRVVKNDIGSMCILNAAVKAIVKNGEFVNLFTVQEAFRPQNGYALTCDLTDGGLTYQGGECYIGTDGVVNVKTGSKLSGLVYIIIKGSYFMEI